MIQALTAAVARWTMLQQEPTYRWVGVGLGVAMCAGVVMTDPPAGLSVTGWRTLGVTMTMALWWLGGVLPIAVTALVPLVAFPLLGVATIKATAVPYAHPLLFLLIGGFVLGRAMEVVGLHERLVAVLLAPAMMRVDARRALGGLMVASAVLSGLVSNTATTVMLLPLALLLADQAGSGPRARSAFALALAYSASIGGVSTLIGTLPNTVFAQVAADQVGRTVSFAQWTVVGVPFVVVAVPVAWWVVTRLLVPAGGRPVPAPEVPAWRPGEVQVLAVVGVAMAAWLTRRPVDLGVVRLPGWSSSFGLDGLVDDAWVAVLAAIVVFLLTARGRFVVDFQDVERNVPWSVMFLLGGGFSLATTIGDSGLTAWLAQGTQWLSALPYSVDVLLICLAVTFLTELTSNTATTQILLPLLAAGAVQSGIDPVVWMVPATISASCAFMMPVATPPNAIAAQGGKVAPGDMVTAGLALNLSLAVLATGAALFLAPLAFPVVSNP